MLRGTLRLSSALVPASSCSTEPKNTEKLRIVLDCAAKHKEQSLNDMPYQGPDTTANLVGVLLRFRKECVAVKADRSDVYASEGAKT
ncbi:unnamed protein product [Echinostoma caproni]|uniref:Secreted protein n=1 Tax=Echinostoma caproni TaxID=27848 RepID=A0A183B3L7_9TREM|nr:unnamed protein product [Echinostoma caproni]